MTKWWTNDRTGGRAIQPGAKNNRISENQSLHLPDAPENQPSSDACSLSSNRNDSVAMNY